MVALPAATPVTIPLLLPTVATPVEELDHTPPPVGLDRAVVELTHTTPVPEMADGDPLTVTVVNTLPHEFI